MADTSPAAELREAADRLRELATAAAEDSGPNWRSTRHFPEQPDATYTSLWTDRRPLLRGGGGRGRPPAYVSAPVGDYIAAMDPAVGAAIADWLDEISQFAALYASVTRASTGTEPAEPEYDVLTRRALAVARQILGTEASR